MLHINNYTFIQLYI